MIKILQITFNYQIPVYWLLGALGTAIIAIAQVYGMAKNIITRVDSLEKKEQTSNEKLDKIAEDVAYIKGKIDNH
jgi:hypothetical protein